MTVTNPLIASDTILFTIGSDVYTQNKNISCLNTANCTVLPTSTPSILLISLEPTNINLNSFTISLLIDGLISAAGTGYQETKTFSISTFTSSGRQIDQGTATYNISCGDASTISLNCRTCKTGLCYSCYNDGTILYNASCIYNCSSTTQYQLYNGNGSCLICDTSIGCFTCYNSTTCRSCLFSPLIYYLYADSSCQKTCPTTTGFYSFMIGTFYYCSPCAGSNCLICSGGNPGQCTSCGNNATLDSGSCNSNCILPNSYISSDYKCTACDKSCSGCSEAGNNKCKLCAYPYYNYNNYCLNPCPLNTAIILTNNTCGCTENCTTC